MENIKDPAAVTISAWIGLFRLHTAWLDDISRALKAAELPPLQWYDLLLELDRAPEDGLRQLELGRRVLIAKYNLSRLVDRLEAEGLIERQDCAEDGRGRMLCITPAGRAMRARMWPVYRERIHFLLGSRLDGEALRALDDLLGHLLGAAGDVGSTDRAHPDPV